MKKDIVVREYVDDDFESLIQLYGDCGGIYDESRDTRDRLQSTAEDLCLFVAASDNEVVGSVMILDNPHTFSLMRFCVRPGMAEEAQNVISQQLLVVVESIAQSRGHENITVFTDATDEDSSDLYKELDFIEIHKRSCLWKPVGDNKERGEA